MKTILTIGHNHYLIPSSVNVNAIITSLSKASELDWDFSGSLEFYRLAERPSKIELKLVPDENIIISARPPKKAITESASPDAHNTF